MKIHSIMHVLRPARKHLARSDAPRVVTVTVPTARNPHTQMAAVSANRAAVENLTRTLALELAGEGILVNALSVGFVDTPLQRAHHADAGDAAHRAWLAAEAGRRAIPLRRAVRPRRSQRAPSSYSRHGAATRQEAACRSQAASSDPRLRRLRSAHGVAEPFSDGDDRGIDETETEPVGPGGAASSGTPLRALSPDRSPNRARGSPRVTPPRSREFLHLHRHLCHALGGCCRTFWGDCSGTPGRLGRAPSRRSGRLDSRGAD